MSALLHQISSGSVYYDTPVAQPKTSLDLNDLGIFGPTTPTSSKGPNHGHESESMAVYYTAN